MKFLFEYLKPVVASWSNPNNVQNQTDSANALQINDIFYTLPREIDGDDQDNEETMPSKLSNVIETIEEIETEIERKLSHAEESTAGDGDFMLEDVADDKPNTDAHLVEEDGMAIVETKAFSISMFEGASKAEDSAETGFGSDDFVSFASSASELVTGYHSTLNLRNFAKETDDSSEDEVESATIIETNESNAISPLNIQSLIVARRLNIGKILLIHGNQLSSNALQQKHV
jgi:hypothetical protein